MKADGRIAIQQVSQPEMTYKHIRNYLITAQKQVYTAVNFAMVIAYWQIGREIYELCGENERAAYGKQVLQEISQKLAAEFGKGYSVQSLRNMRQFYIMFPKRSTLCSELSWSHWNTFMC